MRRGSAVTCLRRLAPFLVLAVLVAAVFRPVLDHGFIDLDDADYITGNPIVRDGLTARGLAMAFTSRHAANWHPLTWISHMLDVQLFGLKPAGHHAVSLLLHLAAACLLFVLLRSTTGVTWPGLAVAALFAVHPLHVEPVAWLSERKEVLSAVFWWLTLLAYARYARRPGTGRYLVVFGCLSLGLMAKATLVTVPVVLLLMDYWPLGRWRRGTGIKMGTGSVERSGTVPVPILILEKIPLLLPVAGSAAATWVAQTGVGAVVSFGAIGPGARLSNAVAAYARYLSKTVWPSGLSVFYPHQGHQAASTLAVSAAVLLALTAAAVLLRRRGYPALGWWWFVVTPLPVIGLVQVGAQAMADRYAYIPMTGLFILIVWGARDLLPAGRTWGAVLACVLAEGVLVLAFAARVQVGRWKNMESLYVQALRVDPSNWLAVNGLGELSYAAGDKSAAMELFFTALKMNPAFSGARFNLGRVLEDGGRLSEAEREYRKALDLTGNYRDARLRLGDLLVRTGRAAEAVAVYRAGLALFPDDGQMRNNLGVALLETGNGAEAARVLEEALRLAPDSADVAFNLGMAYEMTGRPAEAAAAYGHALDLFPGHVPAARRLSALKPGGAGGR